MLTWNNTAWDFKEEAPRVAIVPLACFEPHSTHLPVGTDELIMSEVGKRVARQLGEPAFLLPTWPLGTSGHHAGDAGAIYLRFETLWAVVRDVVSSLHAQGIHKVAVLNNHGSAMTTSSKPIGNFVVKTAVRQLNYETPGLSAIWVQPFTAARDELTILFPSAKQEIQAGAVETSILNYLAPERVKSPPADYVPEIGAAYLDFGPFRKFAPDGVWGRPSEASAEKGVQALDVIVKATVAYIQETFDLLGQMKGNGSGEI